MAYRRPVYYFGVPEDHREARCHADGDLCHIEADPNDPDDHDVYAIRCTLDIPIKGVNAPIWQSSWGK